jgi:hypothetical protein
MEKKKSPPRIRDLFAWESASFSPYAPTAKSLTFLGGAVVVISLIFILFQEWLAAAVAWAAFFLFFALSRIPPEKTSHKITTQGIISFGHTFLWQELGPFWFTTRGENILLHISQRSLFTHLILVIAKSDQEKVQEILAQYLPYIELPEKSSWDKLSDWLAKKFPPRV